MLDRLDRRAAAGLADPEEARASLGEWLGSEPKTIDPEKADLMRALGIGQWRR